MLINKQKFKVKRYSSGEMKLCFEDLNKYIIDNKVEIIYNNEESIFELFIIINYYKDIGTDVSLVLSYLPYQRMDHINNIEVQTLKYVAKLINNLNLDKVIICEPHSDIDMINNSEKISYIEKILPIVYKEINFNYQKDVLLFTDKGSVRRYSYLAKNYVYAEKTRDLKTGLISSYNMIGDIKPNQKVVIVDDIISTGDTICECIEQIKTNNEVYIVCGHYEKNKYNLRLQKNNRVKKIFSTNSLTKRQTRKLKLYKVEDII